MKEASCTFTLTRLNSAVRLTFHWLVSPVNAFVFKGSFLKKKYKIQNYLAKMYFTFHCPASSSSGSFLLTLSLFLSLIMFAITSSYSLLVSEFVHETTTKNLIQRSANLMKQK